MRETLGRCDALLEALGRWRLRREKRLEDLEPDEAERIGRMLDELVLARRRALAHDLSREGLLDVMVRGAELLGHRRHDARLEAARVDAAEVGEVGRHVEREAVEDLFFAESRDFFDLETGEGLSVVFTLVQDRPPA